MTSEPPPADAESGLPDRRGEIVTSLPWILRCLLAAAIGAAVGFLLSLVLAPHLIGRAAGWIIIAATACAATLLSIRKLHAWHLSTFADGTLVGLLVWPVAAILTAAIAWPLPSPLGFLAFFFLHSVISWLILVPTGWIAGFAYHVALSAAERARRGEDESSAST